VTNGAPSLLQIMFVMGRTSTFQLLQSLLDSPHCVAVSLAALFSVSQIINEINGRGQLQKGAQIA